MSSTIYVHATPAAAISEIDARNGATAEWLSDQALEVAAAAVLMSLDADDPKPLAGDPDPAPSRLAERVSPVDLGTTPRQGSDVVDPGTPPSSGLPGGVPGGPPEVPEVV